MASGIYAIYNLKNGKLYIGSAINLERRKADHFASSSNPHLKNAIKKYGKDNFEFVVLEYVKEKEDLVQREQYWIDQYDTNLLYNIALKAYSCLGVKRTEAEKAKIKASWTTARKKDAARQKKDEHKVYWDLQVLEITNSDYT